MSVYPEDYGMASLLPSACTHLWEHALAVADQETSLATSTITDHHEFLAVLRRRRDVCARAARGSRVHCAIGSPGASPVVAVGARVEGSGAVLAAHVVVLNGLHRHGGREGGEGGRVGVLGLRCGR